MSLEIISGLDNGELLKIIGFFLMIPLLMTVMTALVIYIILVCTEDQETTPNGPSYVHFDDVGLEEIEDHSELSEEETDDGDYFLDLASMVFISKSIIIENIGT
uniref:Col_cuticle_N domain-containing protein n=1 Tax=Bursaphelenchus xylophilus TaxID=6326 RepID=A0A1I7RVM6_BURXY